MYADDTNVTFSAATIPDLESQINSDLKYIDCWLKANKLSLNVAKIEFMVISSRQKLQSLTDYTVNTTSSPGRFSLALGAGREKARESQGKAPCGRGCSEYWYRRRPKKPKQSKENLSGLSLMKISLGRPTFMKSLKKYPLV